VPLSFPLLRTLLLGAAFALSPLVSFANDRYTFNGSAYDSLGAAESVMRAFAGPVGGALRRCGEGTTTPTSSTITYCAPTRTPSAWFDHYVISAISSQCPVSDPNLGPRCNDESTAVSLMVQNYQASQTTNCLVSFSVAGAF